MRMIAKLQADLDRAKTEAERQEIRKQIEELNRRLVEP
jgi:hypothetical protein